VIISIPQKVKNMVTSMPLPVPVPLITPCAMQLRTLMLALTLPLLP
jgi:hypothetical protein